MSLALGLRFSRQAQVHVEHSAVQWQCSVCNRTYLNIFRVIWGDRKTANFDEHMTLNDSWPFLASIFSCPGFSAKGCFGVLKSIYRHNVLYHQYVKVLFAS